MADHTVPAHPRAGSPLDSGGEITIRICPSDLGFWEYRGARAQLRAEGIIPDGIVWPEGDRIVEWRCAGVRYWLRRVRPDGLKGPKKMWVNGDWWMLRGDRMSFEHDDERRIRLKARALADEIHRQSPAGRAQWASLWSRYGAAQRDRDFQRFKAAVLPARERTGRKPKPPHQQGASA